MKIRTGLVLVSLLGGLLPVAAFGQLISVALEQHNLQNGAGTVASNGAVFFATVEDVPGITGATLTTTPGPYSDGIGLDDDGDYYELQANRANLPTLLSDFSLSAEYTIGTGLGGVTITGPGGDFDAQAPVTPLFTINGATPGIWNTGSVGLAAGSSFSITLNNYSTATPGGNYAWYFSVGDSSGTYTQLGELGGFEADGVPYVAPSITFTYGLPLDGGDADDSTYGFTAGSQFYIEAGFFNVIGLGDAELAGVEKAFILGRTTGLSFTTSAIPEPSTYAAIFGALALVGAAIHRRRR